MKKLVSIFLSIVLFGFQTSAADLANGAINCLNGASVLGCKPTTLDLPGAESTNAAGDAVSQSSVETNMGNDCALTGCDKPSNGFVQQCTTNYIMCGMAVLTAAQMVATLSGGQQGSSVAAASACTGQFCSTTGGIAPTSGVGTTITPGIGSSGTVAQKQLADAQGALKSLATQGYTYDAATNSVTNPDGSSTPASSYASADGLKKLGATPATIKSIEQALKKDSSYGSFGYDEGGGGSAAKKGAGYPDANKGLDMNAYMKSLMGAQASGRDVSGLQVKMGTDSVGVVNDNLFQMVHRSYLIQQPTLDQSGQ